jgi:hypothetical protein
MLIVIYGSAYINNQKKFLITENEMASAKWIKENLPSNRIIVSSTPISVVRYYSKSNLVPVSSNFYYSQDSVAKLTNKNDAIPVDISDISAYVITNGQNTEKLNSLFVENRDNLFSKTNDFLSLANDNIAASKLLMNRIRNSEMNSAINSENLYIYYSERSKKNPYVERPYESYQDPKVENFIFDNYPDKFERIYEKGGDGKVIIWKVL